MSSKRRYLKLAHQPWPVPKKTIKVQQQGDSDSFIQLQQSISLSSASIIVEYFTLHRRTLLTCLPAGGGRRGPVPPTHTQRKELSARKSLKTMSVNMMCQDVTSCNVFKNICNVLKILMHSKLKPAQDSLCMHCIGNLKSCILTNFTSHLSCLAIINAACGLFYFII